MADQQPAAKPRSRVRLIVQAVFSLALVVVLFYYLLKDVDLAQVWAEIRAMTWMEDAALLAIAAWNLATYGLLWMSVTPGLAKAFIYQGDPEQAAAVLHQSIDLVERTRSAAGLRRIFKAGWQLRPWRHEPFVQDVQDRLLALGCAVPPQ